MRGKEVQSLLVFGKMRLVEPDFIEFTKSAFESNPRSKRLRDLCVGLTKNLARLLWEKELTTEERRKIESDSRGIGEKLVELDIVHNMHVGRKPITFLKKGPVMVAEFVAGQLLPYSGHSVRSKESIEPVIEECNLTDDVEHFVLQTEQMSPVVKNFFVDGWIVGNAIRVLDCQEEVRFKYKDGLFEE